MIFTSDNGGERFSYNWPFTGQKFDLREGGIRVPGIVRWPGVTKPASVSDQPVITMDWTATMIAAAGAKVDEHHPFDGENVMPILLGQKDSSDRMFFWRTKRQGAVRNRNWKYLRDGKNEFLFNLSIDERENADFKEREPATLDKLRNAFNKWEATLQQYPTA